MTLPLHENDRRAGLAPPRFSLASMMAGVAVLGVLFATLVYFGAHATVLLLLFCLAVFAHVAGNALGSKLRASGDRPLTAGPAAFAPGRLGQPVAASDFAPATGLSKRSSLGRPAVIATAIGVVLGGVLGGYGLTLLMVRPTAEIVSLAVAASAVLGGIWSFLAASFVQVAMGAAWQAAREQPRSAAAREHQVTLYTRQGCHLCDEADELLRRYGLEPSLVDIDQDPELVQRYTDCVPVVVLDGRERFRGRVNEILLQRLLR